MTVGMLGYLCLAVLVVLAVELVMDSVWMVALLGEGLLSPHFFWKLVISCWRFLEHAQVQLQIS